MSKIYIEIYLLHMCNIHLCEWSAQTRLTTNIQHPKKIVICVETRDGAR